MAIGNGGTTGSITGNVTNNGTLQFNRSDAVTYAGAISGTGSLTKLGPGLLTLTGSNSYSGDTIIQGGTLLPTNAAALASTSMTLETNATVRLDTADTIYAPSLSLMGVQAILPTATHQIVSLGSFSIDQAAGGRLDIGKGRIEIAPGGITEAELRADLITGRGVGNFQNTNVGIVTSAPNPVPFFVPVIGYTVLPSGAAIVAWPAFGDTNLDGSVDFDDVIQVLAAGLYDTDLPATRVEGDFGYSGTVNFDDVLAMTAVGLYDKGSYLPGPSGMAAMSIGDVTVMPEPAASFMALAGLGCVGYSMRRRRNRT